MTRSSPKGSSAGASAPLSPLIHGRVRLLIISHLLRSGRPLPFTRLRAELGLTDGTLSVHLSRLQRGGIVTTEKRFVDRRPQTLVRITAEGRRLFRQYVRQLKEVVPGLA